MKRASIGLNTVRMATPKAASAGSSSQPGKLTSPVADSVTICQPTTPPTSSTAKSTALTRAAPATVKRAVR